MKSINVELNFDELVIMTGLSVGHQMRMVDQADQKHWQILRDLHVKLTIALNKVIEGVQDASTGDRPVQGPENEVHPDDEKGSPQLII